MTTNISDLLFLELINRFTIKNKIRLNKMSSVLLPSSHKYKLNC